jgi:hypothetical protein
MSWAARRRFYILGGIALVVLIAVAVALFFALHKPAMCTDGIQNGGETGVDCGGPCPYLCAASVSAPSVRFVRALAPASGRTDVIAYIDNSNPAAAVKDAAYRIDLYGPDGALVASKTGTVDLPPRATAAVFVPNFFSGYQTVSRAFLTFDQSSLKWYAYQDDRTLPSVGNYALSNAGTAPAISVPLTNPSVRPLYGVKVIAAVFDANGNAMAASQTLIQTIPANGAATATFTWNAPFPAPVARVDVLPVVPLPGS